MWMFGRPFLLAALLAMSVFVLGPEIGSIDDDGDCGSGVPAVIVATRPAGDLSRSTRANRQPENIRNAATLIDVTNNSQSFGTDESELALRSGRSALRSFCLLRC
jgi:hypothetical protein